MQETTVRLGFITLLVGIAGFWYVDPLWLKWVVFSVCSCVGTVAIAKPLVMTRISRFIIALFPSRHRV